jgi:predicted transcriptional regulator
MLGKSGKLRVRTGAGKDLGVSRGDGAPPLALERPAHDCGAAARETGVDDLVNELNQLIWKAYRDLLAHPNMVAMWYREFVARAADCVRLDGLECSVLCATLNRMASAPHPLSLRLGRDGLSALDEIARRRGLSRAEAARQAITETAERERRRSGLAAEARRLMQDKDYVREAREVTDLMETLRGPW